MRPTFNQQVLIAAVLGVTLGIALNAADPSFALKGPILYLSNLIGKGVFINLLNMILIPLVFTSIVVGIANLRAHAQIGRVWKLTLLYFFCSTSLAIISSLIVVNIFKPGIGLEIGFPVAAGDLPAKAMGLAEYIKEFMAGMFMNPFKAMATGNILPTIIFAIFMGVALVIAGDSQAKTILRLCEEFFNIVMMMVGWIMKLLPIGLFALLTDLFASQDIVLLKSLAKFMLIVVGTTVFHGFISLPAALWLITKRSPVDFFTGMRDSLITAFSTSSSSATLPVTMKCVENNLKVDKDIAGFILPLGATANMDGTAIYEAMAAIFVSNLVGIELNLIQQVIVFFTAMVASIGAPGIPSAGLVTMLMVLQSVGLPVEAVAILIPIDRPLDAIRTVVNVEGDAIGSCIVQHLTTRKR